MDKFAKIKQKSKSDIYMTWEESTPIHDNVLVVDKIPTFSLLLVRGFPLMSLEYGHSFLNLALERVVILQHVEELSVIDLEQHAGDLAGQVGVHPLDEREESLTQHLLLLLRRSGGQHASSEGLLALDEDGLLGLWSRGHHLARHHLTGRVPGCWRVLERLLGADLLSHGHRSHAGSGHHHGLRSRLDSHLRPGSWRS